MWQLFSSKTKRQQLIIKRQIGFYLITLNQTTSFYSIPSSFLNQEIFTISHQLFFFFANHSFFKRIINPLTLWFGKIKKGSQGNSSFYKKTFKGANFFCIFSGIFFIQILFVQQLIICFTQTQKLHIIYAPKTLQEHLSFVLTTPING